MENMYVRKQNRDTLNYEKMCYTYIMKISKKHKMKAVNIAKTFKLTLYNRKLHDGIKGQASYHKNYIEIDINNCNSVALFWTIFFHEICHCLCYRQKLYSTYHYDKEPKTQKEIMKFRRVGLKAERFVDQKAEKLLHSFFPHIKYVSGYQDKGIKQWYYKVYLNKYFSVKK